MATYEVALLFTGVAILGAVALPRLVADKPMSFLLIYVVAGMSIFALPLGIEFPSPDASHVTPQNTAIPSVVTTVSSS